MAGGYEGHRIRRVNGDARCAGEGASQGGTGDELRSPAQARAPVRTWFAGEGAPRDTKTFDEHLRGAADCAAAPLGLYPPPGTSPNSPDRSLWAAGCTAKTRSAKSRQQRRSRRNHGRFVAILKLTNQVQGVPQSATISKLKRLGEEK
jgi:hypothetical protein